MAVALRILDEGMNARDLWLYDTFEGMTDPTEEDIRARDGLSAAEKFDAARTAYPQDRSDWFWAEASLEDVRANLSSTGYPDELINYVEGPVETTIPGTVPEQIALLRLDTDWYESTRHELEHLYPRLAVGGVLIIDDYGHWQGARRAVDEYLAATGARLFLSRIDYTGRLAVKLEA